jgi:chromate reductase, NAD(P)H dehydrogenase (quinone)
VIPAFHWTLPPKEPARSRNASVAGFVHRPARSDHPIRILAIAGSLRQASSNSALVNVAAALPLASVELIVYGGLAALPPFNPDNDGDSVPEAVRRFRQHLLTCDAVLIASPEYAHSVPGVLKNALDWVIDSGELIDKPVALISASARTRYAWAALVEILSTMSARVIGEASIAMSLEGRTLDVVGMSHDLALRTSLTSALDALARAARDRRRS